MIRYFINKRFLSHRPEQKKLRNFLINNKPPTCILCQKQYPLYVLECAHIKPRCISNYQERHDFNIVNWMCRNCHKLYDYGDLSINPNGILVESNDISYFDIDFNLKLEEYHRSDKYFNYHYQHIFKKN